MMPTLAWEAPLHKPQTDTTGLRAAGFTLLEVLLALSVLALLSAVAVPSLARRLDAAFLQADLAQISASARDVALRCAALAEDCEIEGSQLEKPLGDGSPAFVLPPGWRAESGGLALRVGRNGVCSPSQWRLRAPGSDGPLWLVAHQAPGCEVRLSQQGGS